MGDRKTMSTELQVAPATEVTITPAAPVVNAQQTPQVPAPASAKTEPPAEEKPSWLDARLERERRSVLKELGIESLDEAKKTLTEAAAKKEAEKSDAQKRGELEKDLASERKRMSEVVEALNAHATAQLKTLSDAQRAAVTLVAGDDPAKQLKTIEALRPTWAGAPAAPAASGAAEAVRNTATAPAGPKDDGGANVSPPDHKAIHAELMKTNPIFASRYALEHGVFQK
jgi:hypothetical protein